MGRPPKDPNRPVYEPPIELEETVRRLEAKRCYREMGETQRTAQAVANSLIRYLYKATDKLVDDTIMSRQKSQQFVGEVCVHWCKQIVRYTKDPDAPKRDGIDLEIIAKIAPHLADIPDDAARLGRRTKYDRSCVGSGPRPLNEEVESPKTD